MLSEIVLNELQELQSEYTGFKVTDLDSANWCFRKLRALKEQEAEFRSLAEKEVERIRSWYDAEKSKLEKQEVFFESLLEEYAYIQRKDNNKFKLSSPYGKISFRKQQPKWNYDDEQLLESLKRSKIDSLIRVKEEVNKDELKKVATVLNGKVLIDGEFIEGVEVLEQDEAIKIEVSE
jgi:phage host-nuclease inhibitor protein Gam